MKLLNVGKESKPEISVFFNNEYTGTIFKISVHLRIRVPNDIFSFTFNYNK